MKILFISNGIEKKDGWSKYTKTLTDELTKHGHEVVHSKDLGDPLPYFYNPLVAFLKARTLKKQIKAFDPDIIHITAEPYSAMLPRLGKTIAKKTVLTVHGSYGVRMFEGRNARRSCWVMRNISKVITVSEYSKKRLTEEISRHCKHVPEIRVVKNGTILPEEIAHTDNQTKQVICVGGVKPRKGILESLKAFALYVKHYDKDVHLSIIGALDKNDSYVEKVQNFIYGQSLSDFVTLTGSIDDPELKRHYQRADLYLMPSKTSVNTFEGFGLVYIEAAGHGIPCIGSNESGAAEAIDEGVSGLMFNPEDTEGIAKGMDAILNEGAIKREDCRTWAQKHTAQKMTNETLNIYDQMIAQSK